MVSTFWLRRVSSLGRHMESPRTDEVGEEAIHLGFRACHGGAKLETWYEGRFPRETDSAQDPVPAMAATFWLCDHG